MRIIMERIASFQTQQRGPKKDQKEQKKIGRQQRKERKRAENVPENRATFIRAGRYFSFSRLRFYCDGQSVLASVENTFGGSSLEREPPPPKVQFLRRSLSLSFSLSLHVGGSIIIK